MSRLIKLNSHKKEIILFISISLVVIGFVPQLTIRIIRDANNPYTVEPLALESEDGTYISSFLYTPKGEKSHGGIVVSHRYWGDKKTMEPLSIELVRRGFSVISIDFRGHGASGGQFIWSELVNDMKAAVDYFEYELPYITQIGLIGHSLGAMTAAELARLYPNKINATVAIGSLNFDPSGISNLLMMDK
jgi:dienelactone hydrolase